MVSASPVAGKEQILAEQDWKRADATASPEVLAKRVSARRQTEDGTPRSARVSVTLFVCGSDEPRRPGERREEATARRQLPAIFPPKAEPSGFSWPPPERDLPASEFDRALDPAPCRRVWIFSACFLSGRVPGEPLRRRLGQNTAWRQKRRKTQKKFRESTNGEGEARASRQSRGPSKQACRDQFVAWQTDHGGAPLIKDNTKIWFFWKEVFS